MDRGGAETLIMNLYRHIDRHAVQFDFLVNEERTCDYDAEIEELGGRLYRIPRFALANYLTYRNACRKFFRRNVHPIVHGHIGFPAAIYLQCAKQQNDAFTIAHSHAQNYPLNPTEAVYRIVSNCVRGKADYYLGCSELAGIDRFGRNIVEGGNFHVLKNGIDAQAIRFDPNERRRIRSELDIDDDAPVFGHVGRLTPIKNHLFLLDVFRKVLDELPSARLLLVGRGEAEDEIRQRVCDLGLSDAVLFLGVRDDVPAVLSAMDVFVFTSFREGLANATIEAQASGLPCLLSTGVPQLAKISQTTEFADLSEGTGAWAQKALSLYRSGRPDRSSAYLDALSAGFDIQESADWLSDLYLSNSRR